MHLPIVQVIVKVMVADRQKEGGRGFFFYEDHAEIGGDSRVEQKGGMRVADERAVDHEYDTRSSPSTRPPESSELFSRRTICTFQLPRRSLQGVDYIVIPSTFLKVCSSKEFTGSTPPPSSPSPTPTFFCRIINQESNQSDLPGSLNLHNLFPNVYYKEFSQEFDECLLVTNHY